MMKKIKLFENFESFEDIDDVLVSLQDKGILKIKNKPFFTTEYSYVEDDEISIPKISIRYYITQDLGKIDSITKLDSLVGLLSEFKQAIHRLDQSSTYMIDLGAKELEVKLSVPDTIKNIFDRVSLDQEYGDLDQEYGDLKYNYDEDIDGVPYEVSLKFKVDENLKILVSVMIKTKGVTLTIQELEESIVEHFTQFVYTGLKYVQTRDMKGTWIWEFITE